MTTDVGGLLVAVTGVVAMRLAITGAYLSYLKEGMRLPLVAAGAVLVVLGGLTIIRALRPGSEHDRDAHGGPRVAWLLVLPLLAILLVAPAPLGAYAAERDSARSPAPVTSGFAPLPEPVDGAVELTLTQFLTYSYYDTENSLADVPVRMTGFVVVDPAVRDGYQLTRFTLSCCAADAFPIQVNVRGVLPPIPPNDTWVEVVGTWIEPPPTAEGVERGAALQIVNSTEIEPPEQTYE